MIENSIEIVGKLELGANGGAINFDYLINKPTINGVELSGDMTLDDLGVSEISETELDDMFNEIIGGGK